MTTFNSEKAYPYVYRCQHKITKKYYIGYRERNAVLGIPSSLDLQNYKTSSKIVNPNFEEYDSVILAEFFTGDAAYDYEQQLISECWGDPLLINQNCHLGRARFKRNHCTEKTRLKISAKAKGRRLTDEQKLHLSTILIGRKKTNETKAKMRKPKSDSHKLNMQKAHASRPPVTALTRQKMSDAVKNMSMEKKQQRFENMSNARKGLVSAYDLELKIITKIPKEQFDALKGVKYVGLKSKLRETNG